MDNHDEVLDALTAFGKGPNPQEIPSILEQYLNCVAKNGETLFPWSQLKPLVLRKMEQVISELRATLAAETIPTRPNVENVRFDVIHARIIDSLHKFNGAPFTIQRLCELLIEPKRHYKRSDKFMRGLEKNVLVVSTVDPFGRKVVCESGSKPMVNGIPDVNGSSYPSRDSGLSIPLPPVPGWVTTSSANRKTAAIAAAVVADAGPQEAKTEEAATAMQVDNASQRESDVVPNGVSAGGCGGGAGTAVTSSEFGDQEDPLAVQAEEVVEETVVTMDTSEVSSVVTDGGEAMAEGGEAGAAGGAMTEDREASSSFSSSSSSSSEELSTSSDSVERASPFGAAVHSLNEEADLDAKRPWAAFSHDAKQQEDAPPSTNPPASDGLPEENQSSSEALSSVPPSKSPEAPSSVSSSSSSSSSSLSPAKETAASSSTATAPSSQQGLEDKDKTKDQTSSDDKMESEDVSSGREHEELSSSSSIEPEVQSASCDQTNPADSANPSTLSDASSTTSSSSSSSSSPYSEPTPDPPQAPTSSLDAVRTYAQVAASSSTDTPTPTIHLEPTGDSVPCDSVAGLERLVGSVEQSLASSSSSPFPSSPRLAESSPSLPSSSQPTTTSTVASSTSIINSSTPGSGCSSSRANVPSSTDYDSPDGEPISKRPRLSTASEDDNHPQHHHHRMEQEEDCISTSSDSCMDQGQAHTNGDDRGHQRATIDSSSVMADDGNNGLPQQPASEAAESEEMPSAQAQAEGGVDSNKGPGDEEVEGSSSAGSRSDNKDCVPTSGEGHKNTSSSDADGGAKSRESMMEVGGGDDNTDGGETAMVSSGREEEEPSAMSTTTSSSEDQQPVP